MFSFPVVETYIEVYPLTIARSRNTIITDIGILQNSYYGFCDMHKEHRRSSFHYFQHHDERVHTNISNKINNQVC